MTEPTFNRIDALACLFEAPDDFGNVVRVLVAKSELTILIILSDCIDVPL